MREIKFTLEGRILDAITQAKRNYLNIVSINIPKKEQKVLLKNFVESTGKKQTVGLKMQEFYGIPIKTGKKLSISIEI